MRFRIKLYRLMLITNMLGRIVWMARIAIDGQSLNYVVLSSILGHDTAFAPGYNEDRWRSLRPGMSASEVEALLGRPFRRLTCQGNLEVWA
jgi:outer membrane protein assembly factor BamE (lipoprotein component of BamABCDE complex)